MTMDYKEAVAKVQATKPKENYMMVTLSYSNKIILPYKDGVTLMTALSNAEQLHEPYNDQHHISGIERGAITSVLMSHDEYARFKIAALLGVSPDEVKRTMETV